MCPPLYKHQPSGCTHTSTLQDVSYSLGDLSPLDLGRTEGMIIRSDNLTLCSVPGPKTSRLDFNVGRLALITAGTWPFRRSS